MLKLPQDACDRSGFNQCVWLTLVPHTLCCHPQVFDHPSVMAITNYISTLGVAAAGTAAAAAMADSDDDDSESASSIADYHKGTSPALQLARFPVAAAAVPQAALIGISSLACKTAAGNAVMWLPGVDASSRVPFDRWEVERQEQVSAPERVGIPPKTIALETTMSDSLASGCRRPKNEGASVCSADRMHSNNAFSIVCVWAADERVDRTSFWLPPCKVM